MKRVCLGKITGVHGVKGLVKIKFSSKPFGDDPDLIESLGPVFTSETGSETLQIRLKSKKGSQFLAAIEGVPDRTEAEKHLKTELWVNQDALPALENDKALYFESLTGLPVKDINGAAIGTVKSVQNFGASDLLEIKPTHSQSFYVPLTDDFVPEIGNYISIQNYEEFMN